MKKSLIFKILYLFLVLIVVAGASVFATNTYLASQVSYGNSNVEDALNGLFTLKGNDENYSTDEKVVGKWIDGKPLYRKTITGKTPTAGVSTKMFSVSDIAKDIKQVTSFYGSIFISNTWTIPLNFSAKGSYTIAQIDEGYFKLDCSWFTGRDYHVTFEYTKTTD